MNTTATRMNIGFAIGTGRANPCTEEKAFSMVGAKDFDEFRSRVRAAGPGALRATIQAIAHLQPELLPAGWQQAAGL